jgi:tight adherence protein B
VSGAASAAVGLAAAAGSLLPADPAVLLRRVQTAAAAPSRRHPVRVSAWTAPVAAALLCWAVAGSVVLGAAAGAATRVVTRTAAARRHGRRAAARRAAAVDLVSALAAELRGGAEPRAALVSACGPAFTSVAAAARSPATDPAAALRTIAADDGSELLADLAAAWQVTEAAGAGLAGPATRLAETARAADAVRRELDAALAGPRATAALLSMLPVAGVLMGSALGADPLTFLVSTGAGRVALLAGTLLIAAGVGWTEAIVRRAGGQ